MSITINSTKKQILVVDDDRRIRELLQQFLESEGYAASTAANADEAMEKLKSSNFDLMILDVMMPEKTGFELLENLLMKSQIPVIMLTAMHDTVDRIKGLKIGADDYLGKPFEPQELVLRIENILRRKPQEKSDNQVSFGEYNFDFTTGTLAKNGNFFDITSREKKLLEVLARNIDKLVSREELSKQLLNIGERSVDVQVNRLRKKIEPDPKKPYYIESEWGVGYILRSRK